MFLASLALSMLIGAEAAYAQNAEAAHAQNYGSALTYREVAPVV